MLPALLLALAQSDVAIFVLDDVGKSDISLYGGPAQTPNLIGFA